MVKKDEIKKMLYEHNIQLWNSNAPSPEKLFDILSQFSLISLDLMCDTLTIVFDPELFSLENIVLLKNIEATINFIDFNTIKVWW